MESRLHGFPLSATPMAPRAAVSYNKTSGIRAPLTIDESDSEYSVSPKKFRNSSTGSYYSGSELEFEGFDSGEDELETTSERVRVVDQDEESLEETHFVKEFALSEPSVLEFNGEIVEGSSSSSGHVFSRPSVRRPVGEFGQESGNVNGNVVSRPFVRISDERIYKGIDNVDDSDDSRSFLSESGDELVANESYVVHYSDSRPHVAVMDEKVSESGLTPIVHIKVPMVQKLHIPIAQVSADSDDDSQGSGFLENEGFPGIVGVPSIEVLSRINSGPKVRMLEPNEGDDEESQAENIAEIEFQFLEDSIISNVVLGPSDEKEHIGVENSIHSVLSADMIQDKGPDIDKKSTDNMLVVNNELDSTSDSGKAGGLMHLGEEIQEIDDRRKCGELVGHRESTDLVNGTELLENISDVASATEQGYLCGRVKLTDLEISGFESSSDVGAASLDNEATKSSNTGLADNLVFNDEPENEKAESKSEKDIDLKVESFSSNSAEQINSVHQCSDVKEEPPEGCSEFRELSKAVTESMQIYMSDNLSKDANLTGVINAGQSVLKGPKSDWETREKAENSDRLPGEVEESTFHSDTKTLIGETDGITGSTSFSRGEILLDRSREIDGRVVRDFHEEIDADGGISGRRQIIDPAALAASSEAVRGAVSDDSIDEIAPLDGTENFSAESNSADPGSLSPATPITTARNSDGLMSPSTNGKLEGALSETEKKIEKMHHVRVKYLRLLHRLGRFPENSVASRVLYQLTLSEESYSSQASHLNSAKNAAMELEALEKDDLDFSLCILVIGKTGVGKSATINSIFQERKAIVDTFEPGTSRVKEIIGNVDGVKLKVFDTPGLKTSLKDQFINRKILSSIKKLMQKSPPDIILYVDRVDTQTSNLNDLPVLKSVTSYLGSSIWRKSIVVLTHGTSIPPDGPNGYPLSYKAFIAQQSRIIQQLISHSAGEPLVMNPGSMVPVCLVENHPFAEKNQNGETLLHNGESWRSQLLLLCYSMKILSELSSTVMTQNTLDHRQLLGLQIRSPPLSHFLSSFLRSNVLPKLSNDQSGESILSDVELCYSSDSDQEDDIVYDNLPPFKHLNKSQIAKLTGDQRKAYFDEYDYRIKLFQKKQLREEMRRFRNSKKLKNQVGDDTYLDQETGGREAVAIPLPDMALPPSFDGDGPSHRYRFLQSSSQLHTRPVLGFHGWDHDCGNDGVLVEDKIYVANHIAVGKRISLVGNASIVQSQDDAGYIVDFNLSRRDEDYPIGGDQTSLGLSVMRYRGKLVCSCNLQSQFPVGRKSKLNVGVGLNNKLSGQISIKMSCTDQLQIAALALVPIARAVLKKFFRQSTEDYLT